MIFAGFSQMIGQPKTYVTYNMKAKIVWVYQSYLHFKHEGYIEEEL